jgi:2-dehydro-3-deoxygluconokinase
MRLTPPGRKRLIQADHLEVIFGGSEANVAVSLSQLGIHSRYVTVLPDQMVGDAALAFLNQYGVDTSEILRIGPRLGIYYLEQGADARPSRIVYDRQGSSFSLASPSVYAWEDILESATTLHLSGITPALSENCLQSVQMAKNVAQQKGIRVSFDLNYRSKLWSPQMAAKALEPLLQGVDLLIANEEHMKILFQIQNETMAQTAQKISQQFSVKTVVLTVRESISTDDNQFSACMYTDDHFFQSPVYPIHIVDRVGGGDAFAAGLIYSLENHFSPQKTIDFAVAAGVLKHSIEGDCNLVKPDEIESLMLHGRNGRIQR